MPVVAGIRLGPYEILGLLGAGGMGEVYRARDTRLGREVAVKVLPEGLAGDADRLRRFEREARAVAALNHPNILTVYDVGTHEGVPYVVLELLEGETLQELAGRRAPTQRQVLGFAVQVAQGLDAAHQKGIVHRDLKPANLFVTTEGRVKVLDFGLAKLIERGALDTEAVTASSPTLRAQSEIRHAWTARCARVASGTNPMVRGPSTRFQMCPLNIMKTEVMRTPVLSSASRTR